jgi:hypothetical protein
MIALAKPLTGQRMEMNAQRTELNALAEPLN